MPPLSITGLFSNIFKGDEGEAAVLSSLTKILRNHKNEENYYLIPKATLSDVTSSREIDLLLLHPVLGLYAIEVKNWSSLDAISTENNPFSQANQYQDMLMTLLQKEFGKIPINIEYRVIFPSISVKDGDKYFQENPYYAHYKNHTFFKEHLADRAIFDAFCNASILSIPNKKEFLKIASLLVPTDKLKKNQEKIIPIITKDEIIFFDQKQLSIMNGYNGGFRIIRGVAGTGKTVILTNFVSSRLSKDPNEKFLVVCFNKKLAENIKVQFGENFSKKNIAIYSIMGLLEVIGFDEEKAGIAHSLSLPQKYKAYESVEALQEFRSKLKARLEKHPIDYFLCDETQDMPPGFMRIIYEEIHDCIFFIDEAQRFYNYTMQTIAEIFHHPHFEKINMQGRVKNLKNIYRTPSNIAKCALEILSNDATLNAYYKTAHYLNEGFLTDVNFVLEDGSVQIGAYDDFKNLEVLIKSLPQNQDNIILTYSKPSLEVIEKMITHLNAHDYIKAMTLQSVKGLEAQTIIIHGFGHFLAQNSKREKDIFYRQIYVLLTRAQEKIYLSIPNIEDLLTESSTKHIIEHIQHYARKSQEIEHITHEENSDDVSKISKLKLAKIRPVLKDVKESTELVVAASELFAIIGGLFSF